MPLSNGDKLGPYEILASIGAGGMGEVYRAHDSRMGRDVAIKISAERFNERFDREVRAVAALNHPNICHVYDVGPNYLVMELVEGPTLAEKIKEGPIPLEEALNISKQIADALEAAHEKGIVHRDVKPGNIKIRSDAVVKVLDFGLATAAPQPSKAEAHSILSTESMALTEAGTVLGTAAYMAPEQAGGKPADKRADIWSFGVVLWELLTGRRLFAGETVSHTLADVLRGPIDFDRLPRKTPAAIRVLVRRCLERNANNRLRDIGEARVAIAAALAGETPLLEGAPPASPWRASWSRWGKVAVLAIASGFALWKWSASVATPGPKVLRLAVSFPASQAYVDGGAQFVPDGSAIVYMGRGPHGHQLYYRRLDQLEGTALPGTDDACCPEISPSGEWVAFEANGAASKVSVRGGAPIVLAKVAYRGGLSWASDDSIFSAEGPSGLFRIPANGGPVKRIAVPDPERESGWFVPMALPDAKSVLVFAYKRPRGAGLAMVRVVDGQVTELQGEGENPIGFVGGYLIFGRSDGKLGVEAFDPARPRSTEAVIPVLDEPLRSNSGVAASLSSAGDLVYVKATGRSRITFLDQQGRIAGGIPDERDFDYLNSGPRISPDGRQLVARELTDNVRRGDLWLYDVASGLRQPLTTGLNAAQPQWTPDGRHVLFILRPDAGQAEGWWVPADRSGPAERFIAMPIPVAQEVLSPDSRYAILTAVDPKTGTDLYLVDLKGDRKPQPLERSSFNETSPAVSPDGRWLVYVSNESGHDEVYVRPFPAGGAHVQVSANGGSDPRWEKDSHGILYRKADGFMKVRLSIGADIFVAQRDLLFTGRYRGYDLSPNGSIIALRPGSADAEIIVVTNWMAELKAKLGKR